MRTKKKVFKTMFTFVMAMLMTLAMGMTALAAGTNTLTINPTVDGITHTYEVYKVFTGTKATVGTETVLTNVNWATGVKSAQMLSKLENADFTEPYKTNAGFTGTMDAATVAEKLALMTAEADKALLARIIADCVGSEAKAGEISVIAGSSDNHLDGLEDGYYFVKDVTSDTGYSVNSRYMLTLLDSVTITPKATLPTVDKKIMGASAYDKDENTATIGDVIKYKVSSVVVDTTGYTKYEYKFTDTLSKGLTYVTTGADVLKVFVGDTELDASKYVTTVTLNADGTTTITVHISELLGMDGKTVALTYAAILNENADCTSTGNPNTVALEYSNNPAIEGVLGKTPDEVVKTYATEIKIHKINQASDPLAGAEFKIQKDGGSFSRVGTTDATGNVTFSGLGEGNYTIFETAAPTGYNQFADPIKITITRQSDGTWNYTVASHDYVKSTSGNEITVLNKQGITLPSTGGIGTTIFYVVGGILVAAAVILLITRKRMASEA